MLIPLTAEPSPGVFGKGFTWLVTRQDARYPTAIVGMVQIFPCVGARSPEMNQALGEAMMGGGWDRVQSLRRDPHDREPSCWLHSDGFCLSQHEA
jgi:protein-L-isoaspartate(D-aspartate) O-methyltransferase